MRSSSPAGGFACSCSSRTSQSNDIICKNPGIVSHSSSALSSASFRLATSLTSRSPSTSLSAAVGAALTSSPSPRPPAAVQDCASSCGAAAGGAAGRNAVLGCASHMPSSSSRSPSFFTATHTGRMKEAAAASSTRIFPAVRVPFSRCTDTSWRSFSSSSFSSAEVQDEDCFFGKHAQQRSAGSRSASRCWLQPALRRQHQRLFSAVTLLLTAVLLLLWQEEAAGFQAMVELPGGGKQCVGEQLSKHVLVVGEVHLLHPVPSASATGRKATTPLLVTALDSSSQLPIYKQQGKEHVRTAFTTTRAGTHSFCVQNTGAERMVVDIQMLWGPEARDYGQIAKAEHLDEVMLQLMRLQDRLKLYQANVLYMRQNEQKMREDSDATASWLMSFCIINVLLLILTALASAYYFKRFFRSKKII